MDQSTSSTPGVPSGFSPKIRGGAPPARQYTLHPVSIPDFEGPLDLLLTLIETEALDVNRVSLSAVTEQYLDRIKQLRDVPPEHLADFLVVAATLLLIKSKRLFPDFVLSDEEEERVASLEEQLSEYRRFRAAAKEFMRLRDTGKRSHTRASFLHVASVFAPPPNVSGASLRSTLGSVLDVLPRFDSVTEEVVRRVVSLEESIRHIQERIRRQSTVVFRELTEPAKNRAEVIISFLALLELVKQSVVAVRQEGAFRDILLSRSSQSLSSRNESSQ